MPKLRMRTVTADLEIRTEQDGQEKRISGYGIVYNRKTRLWGDLYEVIKPGAARKALSGNPDIKCALNHNRRYLFGRTKSGTLKLEEDSRGVRYTATPPEAQWAKDAIASIERGDIDGSSFTFSVAPEHERIVKQKDGTYLREVVEIARIGEMGPVADPAYLDTTAEARAKDEYDSFTASLRAQDEADEIAESQRALASLRRKKLDLQAKTILEGEK